MTWITPLRAMTSAWTTDTAAAGRAGDLHPVKAVDGEVGAVDRRELRGPVDQVAGQIGSLNHMRPSTAASAARFSGSSRSSSAPSGSAAKAELRGAKTV